MGTPATMIPILRSGLPPNWWAVGAVRGSGVCWRQQTACAVVVNGPCDRRMELLGTAVGGTARRRAAQGSL